jgi:malate dehydrogenase (oxaloacetate-decarboxylating)
VRAISKAIKLHKRLRGKLELKPKIRLNKRLLNLLYTPGVADVSLAIAKDKKLVYSLTGKGNSVAIVTDGTRVLGLGDVGPEAALPVMESKALLFKTYGNIDAVPICLRTKDILEIVNTVRNIAPSFGAINIEDIESPKCLEIVDSLSAGLDIPVFHDDQHGTAVVTLAALLNALKVAKKDISGAKIVVAGAGAAGYGITRLLVHAGARNILVLDSKGIIHSERPDLNEYKKELVKLTNPGGVQGDIEYAIRNADVFIGVSGQKDLLKPYMIRHMAEPSIVFALTNPEPEILPEAAKKAGADIIATGRSDFPNQVNNAVVFPFLMRKILDKGIKRIDEKLLYDTAKRLAAKVRKPTKNRILPRIEEVKKL